MTDAQFSTMLWIAGWLIGVLLVWILVGYPTWRVWAAIVLLCVCGGLLLVMNYSGRECDPVPAPQPLRKALTQDDKNFLLTVGIIVAMGGFMAIVSGYMIGFLTLASSILPISKGLGLWGQR
jgi:hypothetical protein